MNPALQLLSAIGTIMASVAFATWVLSNKLSTTKTDLSDKLTGAKAELMTKVSDLQTDIAVMKANEKARDEKTDKMWSWWMTALEQGWIKHMKGLSE